MNASHDDLRWEDEIAAYTLDALDEDERHRVEAHLTTCERCRDRARWFGPALDALSESVPQLDPPSRLRRRIMRDVRTSGGEPRAVREPWLSRRPGWLSPVAVTVALAAAVGGGVLGFGLADRESGPVVVAGAPAAPQAADAEVELIRDGDSGTLRVDDLPRLKSGDVYQAWIRRGEQIDPSTVFVVDAQGDGSAAISQIGEAEELLVTREPAGGSSAPSTEPLLSVKLEQS